MVTEKVNRKDNRILQVKISEKLKLEFDTMCSIQSVNKSSLIRTFLEQWIDKQLEDAEVRAAYNAKMQAYKNILTHAPNMIDVLNK